MAIQARQSDTSQQMAAFGPFVRQFVIFSEIASRASNDDVIRIIVTASGDRDDVIDMIFSSRFAKFLLAIVTTSSLPLILLLHILHSIFAAIHPPARIPFARFFVANLSLFRGFGVTAGSRDYLPIRIASKCFSIFAFALFAIHVHRWLTSFFGFLKKLRSGRNFSFADRTPSEPLFNWFSLRGFSMGSIGAFSTPSSQPVLPRRNSRKIQASCRFYLFAVTASYIPIRRRFLFRMFAFRSINAFSAYLATRGEILRGIRLVLVANAALFCPRICWYRRIPANDTNRVETIFFGFISIKMLRRGFFVLMTTPASFQGNRRRIIHDDRNCLSFLALSSCCQESKATLFSNGLITPSLGNMPTIPFFATQQKAESEVRYA